MQRLVILVLYLSVSVFANTINLTKEEKDFIKDNPIIKVAMMPDFTPFSYYIKNTPVGFEYDLLKIISERTGLTFEETIGNWTTIYNAFKEKKVDMITSISYKKYREPFTIFTSAYYEIPIMIFVRDDFGEYQGLRSLNGKKVGVLKDVFYIKELEQMGTMNLVYYDNYGDLTKDLVFGKIDALMQNLPNINYLIKKNLYSNLKLASELQLTNTKKEDLRFGVQPEKPILSSILQKALNSITKKEKEVLVNKWIGSIKEHGNVHIELTEDETAYIDTNTIKYCINPSGLPFEGFDKNGQHVGMSFDYYKLFEQILSAKFEVVKTTSWDQTMNYIKEKKCDMLAFSMETPQRRKYLNFTSHYLEVPLVVATRVDVPFINNILDLEGKKIGIIKGDAFVKILRRKYPSLDIVEVENIYDGLDRVKSEQLFAFIDTLASIGYEFQSKYFGELKIAGKISESLKLSIAVVKEDETLFQILQKTVNSITNEMHRKILTKWIHIQYEKSIDYSLVWKVAIGAIFFILLVMYWNIKIRNANKLLKLAQKDIQQKNIELNKLATTDKLTNINNRRKIEELLQHELNRDERFSHTFGLAILDIDYFKKVNDTFGHQTGDKVLQEIATLLTDNLRKTDFVGRFGGEEFIIICPESNKDEAISLMELIRKEIEKYTFKDIGKKTVSFGLTLSKEGDTIESILKRADKALYEAKNSGRNKVIFGEN